MRDVLPIRTRGLLDRHARLQRSIGEIGENGIGELAKKCDPGGAFIVNRQTTGLPQFERRRDRWHRCCCARRLEKITSIHFIAVSYQLSAFSWLRAEG